MIARCLMLVAVVEATVHSLQGIDFDTPPLLPGPPVSDFPGIADIPSPDEIMARIQHDIDEMNARIQRQVEELQRGVPPPPLALGLVPADSQDSSADEIIGYQQAIPQASVQQQRLPDLPVLPYNPPSSPSDNVSAFGFRRVTAISTAAPSPVVPVTVPPTSVRDLPLSSPTPVESILPVPAVTEPLGEVSQGSPELGGQQQSPELGGQQQSPELGGQQESPELGGPQQSPEVGGSEQSPEESAEGDPQLRGPQQSPNDAEPNVVMNGVAPFEVGLQNAEQALLLGMDGSPVEAPLTGRHFDMGGTLHGHKAGPWQSNSRYGYFADPRDNQMMMAREGTSREMRGPFPPHGPHMNMYGPSYNGPVNGYMRAARMAGDSFSRSHGYPDRYPDSRGFLSVRESDDSSDSDSRDKANWGRHSNDDKHNHSSRTTHNNSNRGDDKRNGSNHRHNQEPRQNQGADKPLLFNSLVGGVADVVGEMYPTV